MDDFVLFVLLCGLKFCGLGSLEPALAECIPDHFYPALEVQLLHYVCFVSLDGLNTDSEIRCHFFVRVSPRNESQDFRLTLRYVVALRLASEPAITQISADDLACQRRIQVNTAGCNNPDRIDQLFSSRFLQHITRCANFEQLSQITIVVMSRQNQDSDLLAGSLEALSYLNSIQVRHRDIKDNHIRLQLPDSL